MLRDYQTNAVKLGIEHAKRSLESQVIVIPTGGGKSHVVAELAKILAGLTGKKILCTAPSAELVVQNTKKYKLTGYPASVFCASAGVKSLKEDVIFGSPISLFNSVDRLGLFGAIIIDECDLITSTLKKLIDNLKQKNPLLRVIGLTATPYRMGMGYIYGVHYARGFIDDTHNPYFYKCTFEAYAHDLLADGYLTKPVLGKNALRYETSGLVLDKKGRFDSHAIDEAFIGKGRLTSDIVSDIVRTTQGYSGVMIFAQTIQHAEEVLESLPAHISGIVHSKLKTNKRTMKFFEQKIIKYIVNVDCLTVGIDWPHVDCIALLRRTESSRLLQQIIGRGLRIEPGKEYCLILDYADNFPVHFPNGDPFDPKIKAKAPGEPEKIPVLCPDCNHENLFSMRPNDAGYGYHQNGYFKWIDTGDIVLDKESRPVPSHFGRRCCGLERNGDRCGYKWTFKKCEACEHENDIAARYCGNCKAEIVDPNEKLDLEEQAINKAKSETHLIEPILNINVNEDFKGDRKIKVIVVTTIFNKIIRLFLRMSSEKEREIYRMFKSADLKSFDIEFYKKEGKSFYTYYGVNKNENL